MFLFGSNEVNSIGMRRICLKETRVFLSRNLVKFTPARRIIQVDDARIEAAEGMMSIKHIRILRRFPNIILILFIEQDNLNPVASICVPLALQTFS